MRKMGWQEASDLSGEIEAFFSDVKIESSGEEYDVAVYVADGLFKRFQTYDQWIRYREGIEDECSL